MFVCLYADICLTAEPCPSRRSSWSMATAFFTLEVGIDKEEYIG